MTTTQISTRLTVPAARTPGQPALSLRPLRLQLRAGATAGTPSTGLVDGAWWPYTDDLATELVPLLAGMAQRATSCTASATASEPG